MGGYGFDELSKFSSWHRLLCADVICLQFFKLKVCILNYNDVIMKGFRELNLATQNEIGSHIS